ncbi:unnamed protein product, partial [Owenia fusiformis]
TIHSDLQGYIKTVDTNTQLRQNMVQQTEETFKAAKSNLERLKQCKTELEDPTNVAAAYPQGVKFHNESDLRTNKKSKKPKSAKNWINAPNEASDKNSPNESRGSGAHNV